MFGQFGQFGAFGGKEGGGEGEEGEEGCHSIATAGLRTRGEVPLGNGAASQETNTSRRAT